MKRIWLAFILAAVATVGGIPGQAGLGREFAFGQGVSMKKVVMVVAERNFRDEEYFQPKAEMEKRGIKVITASTVLDVVGGTKGGQIKPDVLLKDVRARDYDALVFVGGNGAQQYWDDPQAHQLAKDFVNSKKVTAAICIGPVILARAGLLRNKKATVFDSESQELTANGSQYTGEDVQADGLIITAAGPFAAKEFGEKLAAAVLQ